MKHKYTLWKVIAFIFINTSPSFAQQVEHKTSYLNAPVIINFRELADYQKTHPSPRPKGRFVEQGEDREEKYQFHPREISGNAQKFDVVLPENLIRTVSPDPHISFNGILDDGSIIPPDVGGTAGNNYVMESTNQQLDIYTKSGTLVNSLFIENLFSSTSGSGFFDPHVKFDANYDRFIVIVDGFYSNNHSALFIGISETDDPNGNWFIYSFDAINNAVDFLDFPQVGFNKNWVVITGNDFLSNGNTTTKIYVLNRADLYDGSGSTVHTFTDGTVFTSTPSITMDSVLNTEYLVADWDGSSGGYGYMKLFKITGTPSTPAYSAGNTIGVNQPWSENTVDAPQLGSTHKIEIGDTRVNTPVYVKGSLWFTHCVCLPSANPTHAAVDWWQVDPANDSLLQFGRVSDALGSVFYFYPSISVNRGGDALLGYATSSSSSHAGAEYSYHASADTSNSMEDGNLFKPGLATYYKTFGGTRNRYGDFSSTATDPVDNSFWTFQEFANSPANNWGTVVANVGGPTCGDTPFAGVISAVFNSVCPGEGTILNLSGSTSGITGIQFQWQQSADSITDWANATGIGNASSRYETGPITDPTFFRCIVTCSASGLSDTTEIYLVKTNGFVVVANDTICSPGSTQLIASANGTTNWFEADTSTVPLFTGDTLNADIADDTTFYVSTTTLSFNSAGMLTNAGGGGYYNFTYTAGLVFNAISNFTLDTVFVYPNSTGLMKVNLLDAATGFVIDSFSTTITSAQVHTKTAIPVDLQITGGATYLINAEGSTLSSIYRNSSGVSYPYEIPGVLSIIHAINEADGYYYFFYDWRVKSGCDCDKFPVNVHIDSVVVVAFASIDTICFGDSVLLIATGAQNYLWQPDNVSGTSIISYPLSNTTYTVTGTDQYGCSATAQIAVDVITCATGVAEVDPPSSLRIYPNPTTGEFEWSLESQQEVNYTLAVFNMLGQKVMEEVQVSSSGQSIKVNASSLPKGIYLVKVANGNQQWMNRVVKSE